MYNNRMNEDIKTKNNTAYDSIITNSKGTLRYWERSRLAIEAEHINNNGANITFQDFKAASNKLYKNILYCVSNVAKDKKYSTEKEKEDALEEIYRKLYEKGLYEEIRNFLSHIVHKDITIDEDISHILYSSFRLAFEQCKQKTFLQEQDMFFKKEHKDSQERHFTLLGLLCFLCMSLEKDRAYALCDQFSFAKKETDTQTADIIEAIIKQYGRKKSDKIKAHKKAGEEYSPGTSQNEEKKEWNLMCEIFDYIQKPIEGSPNYEKSDKENNKRTSNPYIIDNFILCWIELRKDLRLQFAKTGVRENKRRKLILVPIFDDEKVDNSVSDNEKKLTLSNVNDRYFRINEQYWCKVKDGDKDVIFKIHRIHLRRLAKKLLIGEKEDYIVKSIISNIHEMLKFNSKNKNISASLPRSMKDSYQQATIEKRINDRLMHYKTIDEKSKEKPFLQVKFILWAMQGALRGNKDINKFSKEEYQNISYGMHFYATYTGQFQQQVCNAIPERYEYCKKYIKPSLSQTLHCVAEELQKILESDRTRLINGEEAMYKKHSFSFYKRKKEQHPCILRQNKHDTYKYDYRNIVWLSKGWGKIGLAQQERYNKYTKNIEFDFNNYHSALKDLIEQRPINSASKEEKLYHAANYYANDTLLLEIVFHIINDEFSNKDQHKSDNDFSIAPSSAINNIKDITITIEGKNDKKFTIPIRYITKISYVLYKRNLIQGLSEAESRLNKESGQEKANNEDGNKFMEYFIQTIVPEFKEFGIQALGILFQIENKLINNKTLPMQIINENLKKNIMREKEAKKPYINFNRIIKILNIDESKRTTLNELRKYILHERLKDIFEKKECYIKTVDEIANKLLLRKNLSTIIKERHNKRKEIKKYQCSK